MNNDTLKEAINSFMAEEESMKVILIKENPSGKEIFFENKDIGIKAITDLVSKGYKIG